jgi:WD40 repeat protein
LAQLPTTSHLLVLSSDKCLTLYDLITNEIAGRINNITPTTPTSISCFTLNLTDKIACQIIRDDSIPTAPHQCICVGDEMGSLFGFVLQSEFGTVYDMGAAMKNEVLLKNTYRSKSGLCHHKDCITVITYVMSHNILLSGSMDGTICAYDTTTFDIMTHKFMRISRTFNSHKCNNNMGSLSSISSISHIPNTSSIVSSSQRLVLVWDYISGVIVYKFPAFISTVVGVRVITITHTSILETTHNKIIVGCEDRYLRCYNGTSFGHESSVLDSSALDDENSYRSLSNNVHVKNKSNSNENTLREVLLDKESMTLYSIGRNLSSWSIERLVH